MFPLSPRCAYRWVYTEAVSALPFNGGLYNIFLNTQQSKRTAASVATLTVLSYIATTVVSANSAAASRKPIHL